MQYIALNSLSQVASALSEYLFSRTRAIPASGTASPLKPAENLDVGRPAFSLCPLMLQPGGVPLLRAYGIDVDPNPFTTYYIVV